MKLHTITSVTGDHSTPGNQVSLITHAFEYGLGCNPISAFGIQSDEGIEDDGVLSDSRFGEFGVNEFAEFEVAGADAGFEKDGEGGEVRGEAVVGGDEIEGGDCLVRLAHIGLAYQTVLEELEVWVLAGRSYRSVGLRGGCNGQFCWRREAQSYHILYLFPYFKMFFTKLGGLFVVCAKVKVVVLINENKKTSITIL